MKSYLLLKRAFERQKRISGLSLRSLAARVRLSPGYLSKVLSGQKSLTVDLATKLCSELRVDTIQKNQVFAHLESSILKSKFGSTAIANHSATRRTKAKAAAMEEFHLMDTDAEWLLGKWYRLTLLDLVTCVNFKEDTAWAAGRLGVSQNEVRQALTDLEKFNFLVRDASGALHKKYELLRFPMKFSKEVTRNFHAAQIQRALKHMLTATDQRSYDRRLVTSVGVASDPAHLERAKQILHEALYSAAMVLAQGEPTEVYQINLQLFPHTKL